MFLAFTPSSFVPCFASELFKAPVLSEKPPQIMAVNDEIIDPEFIPEIRIFLNAYRLNAASHNILRKSDLLDR